MAEEGGKDGVLLQTYRPLSAETGNGDAALQGCPDTVVSNIGAACFYADPTNGSSWVQVLVLNRETLAPAQNVSNGYNQDLQCPAATTEPNEDDFDKVPNHGGVCTKQLSDLIGSLNASDLVIAVNQPGLAANQHSQPPVGVGAVLASVGANHGIGGSGVWYKKRLEIRGAVRGTVAVIGIPGSAPGTAAALESAHPTEWQTGALEASIAQNVNGVFEPLSEPSTETATESPVTEVLDAKSTAWPNQGVLDKAISSIGVKLALGTDPRAAYYSTSPASNTSGHWAGVVASLDRLKYSDFSNPSFSEKSFGMAQQELRTEMEWVEHVDDYMATLAMPATDAKSNLWAFFNSVQDAVNQNTQNGQSAEVIATIAEALISVLEIAGGFGHAIHTVATVVVGAYHLFLTASSVGRVEDEPISTEAAKLAGELTNRLDVGAKEIQIRWRNIIVADYGKLRTVGSCTQPQVDSCLNPKENNPGWHISSNDEQTMQAVIQLGLQRELYEKLVPKKFPVAMALQKEDKSVYDNAGGAGTWCPPIHPFKSGDDGAGAWLSSIQAGYDYPLPSYQVRPIVFVNGNGDNPLSKRVFDRMFGALDKGRDYTKGGLAIDEAKFFKDNWPIKNDDLSPPRFVTYGHFAKYFFCGGYGTGGSQG